MNELSASYEQTNHLDRVGDQTRCSRASTALPPRGKRSRSSIVNLLVLDALDDPEQRRSCRATGRCASRASCDPEPALTWGAELRWFNR